MTPDRFTHPAATAPRSVTAVDVGLRAHMQSVYNRMSAGVLVTGLVAWMVSASPFLMNLFLGGPQAYIVMLAPLAVIWFGFNPASMSSGKLRMSFFLLAVLYGISFAAIFHVFTGASIARAFFMTAAAFAGLSVFGYVTKKNLDGIGSFCVMGMFGLLALSLFNMAGAGFGFLGGETVMNLQNMISAVGILVFAGLTAWQTQTTKEMYDPGNGTEGNSRMAWAAALNLYVNFIALFQFILNFVGNRE